MTHRRIPTADQLRALREFQAVCTAADAEYQVAMAQARANHDLYLEPYEQKVRAAEEEYMAAEDRAQAEYAKADEAAARICYEAKAAAMPPNAGSYMPPPKWYEDDEFDDDDD